MIKRASQLVAVVVLLGLLAAGGYAVGRAGGIDLDSARVAGVEQARDDGEDQGASAGFQAGFESGRARGYDRAFGDAYLTAYRNAFQASGFALPADIRQRDRPD